MFIGFIYVCISKYVAAAAASWQGEGIKLGDGCSPGALSLRASALGPRERKKKCVSLEFRALGGQGGVKMVLKSFCLVFFVGCRF